MLLIHPSIRSLLLVSSCFSSNLPSTLWGLKVCKCVSMHVRVVYVLAVLMLWKVTSGTARCVESMASFLSGEPAAWGQSTINVHGGDDFAHRFVLDFLAAISLVPEVILALVKECAKQGSCIMAGCFCIQWPEPAEWNGSTDIGSNWFVHR